MAKNIGRVVRWRGGWRIDLRALGHRDARSTELYAELEPITPAAIFRPKIRH